MKERFIENNNEYIWGEDGIYYLNLQLPENNEIRPIELYGDLDKTYLREHCPILFMNLLLSDTLTKHLANTTESAHERMDLIVKQQGVHEQLKSSDWLKWLQTMYEFQRI